MIAKSILDEQLSAFDYTSIELESIDSIDLNIMNYNLYLDIYGEIIILGEMLNTSNISKTDVAITFSIIDRNGKEIENRAVPAFANYLQPQKLIPFYFVYDNRAEYINISKVRIGVNYNNYYDVFEGYPVISGEHYNYDKDIMHIKGNVENIGQADIEDLKLFGTFYDLQDRVIFIKKGFLSSNVIPVDQKRSFSLDVMTDDYQKDFTHYKLGIFFRDSFKVNKI